MCGSSTLSVSQAPAQFIASGGVTLMGLPKHRSSSAARATSSLALLTSSLQQVVAYSPACTDRVARTHFKRTALVVLLVVTVHVCAYTACVVEEVRQGRDGSGVAPSAPTVISRLLAWHASPDAAHAVTAAADAVAMHNTFGGNGDSGSGARFLRDVTAASSSPLLAPEAPYLSPATVVVGARPSFSVTNYVLAMVLNVALLCALPLRRPYLLSLLWLVTVVRVLIAIPLMSSVGFALVGVVDFLLLYAIARTHRAMASAWVIVGDSRFLM